MRAFSPAFIEGAPFGSAFALLRSAVAGTDFAAARTSVSVIRPLGPVPFTLERSTPSSAAIRRATGDAFTRASSGCDGSRAGCAGDTPASTGVSSLSAFGGTPFFPSSSAFGFFFFFFLLFGFCFFLFFGLWLIPFFFCRFFLLPFFGRFLAFATNERNLVADVYFATFFDVNFRERPILRRFPFHGRLVGLDFGEHFTGRYFIALLFLPRDKSTLGHRVAQLRHLNFRHKQK